MGGLVRVARGRTSNAWVRKGYTREDIAWVS